MAPTSAPRRMSLRRGMGASPIGRGLPASPVPLDTDLGVAQIAGRILGPWIACQLQGAHPSVAAADGEMPAGAAAATDMPWPLLQAGHDRIGRIRPALGEGRL